MSTTIFYFSGRGSSLKVARDIADKLGDAKLIPVCRALEGEVDLSAERIGIIFPVINYGIPTIISRLIKKINAANKGKYFFTVALNGGAPCGSIAQIENRLKSRGLKLSSEFYVHVKYVLETSQEWEKKLEEICAIVKSKSEYKNERGTLMDRVVLTGFLNNLSSMLIHNFDKKFWTDDKCNGCGMCQKICPTRNIVMQNERPVWQHNCDQCFACYGWCPQKAVQSGKKENASLRSTNPFTKLKDFTDK